MNELKKQINKLIAVTEEQKMKHMLYGLTGDMREDDGYIQALKLIRLLIDTNMEIKRKGSNSNETVLKTQLIM